MGLCKCERRKVTNLFCFECKVNVCEHCMVQKAHEKCIIQTYLAWLSDSDFEPACKLCNNPLKTAACIRFNCLCVFHTQCIDEHFKNLPKSTAPAGYKCKGCKEKIFPGLNSTGPMVEQIREKLKAFPWARTGLGLPLLPDIKPATPEPEIVVLPNNVEKRQNLVQRKNANHPQNQYRPDDRNNSLSPTSFTPMLSDHTTAQQLESQSESQSLINQENNNHENNQFSKLRPKQRTADADFNAFKYRRRSWKARIQRLMQNYNTSNKYSEPLMGQGGAIMMIVLVVLVLIFLYTVTHVQNFRRDNDDPLLNEKFNPFAKINDIHVPVSN